MKLNRAFFSILFLVISVCNTELFAQRALYKPQQHEISVQLAGAEHIFPFNQLNLYQEQVPIQAYVARGLSYTYHYSLKDGFRVAAFYKDASYFRFPNIFISDVQRLDWQFQLGYERKYHSGPHQFSIGPDLMYSRGNTELGIETGGAMPFTTTHTHQTIGIGLVGAYNYFINTHFSLGASITLYGQRAIYDDPSTFFDSYFETQNISGAYASIWANFHFVKMKKRCTCPKARR
ncbi:MAG: hypothetical protein AAFY71_09635 [Bacteroidota bacterium]